MLFCLYSVLVFLSIVVFGAIVAITTITAVATPTLGIVEKKAHVVVFLAAVDILELEEESSLEEAGTKHEDCVGADSTEDTSVGNHLDRWTINENNVIFTTQLIDHRSKTTIFEKLGWVRRSLTAREYIKVFLKLTFHDSLGDGNLTDETLSEA